MAEGAENGRCAAEAFGHRNTHGVDGLAMPSHSPAQARLMAAIAHGWHPPAGSGIHVPLAVATEFNQADKGTGIRERRQPKSLASLAYNGPERRRYG